MESYKNGSAQCDETNDHVRSIEARTVSEDSKMKHKKIIRRSWRNVLLMGLVFLLIGCAENTVLTLQSSVHTIGGMGVISSGVLNICNIISSLLLPT